MIRVTDYDFKCAFHGTDGLKVGWETYIGALHATPKQEINVRCMQKSQVDIEALGDSVADTFGEMPTWALAAASRRSNPYLDEARGMPQMEYNDVIDTQEMARKILKVGSQVASEIRWDLLSMSKENEGLLLAYKERSRMPANSTVVSRALLNRANESETILPVFIGGTDGMVEARSTGDGLEGQQGEGGSETTWEPSVLRASTWDLTLRLATKSASLEVLSKLAASPDKAPLYQWFKDFLLQRLEWFRGHGLHSVDDRFVSQLLNEPLRISAQGALIDPLYLADEVLAARARVAKEWVDILEAASTSLATYDLKTAAAPPGDLLLAWPPDTLLASPPVRTSRLPTQPSKEREEGDAGGSSTEEEGDAGGSTQAYKQQGQVEQEQAQEERARRKVQGPGRSGAGGASPKATQGPIAKTTASKKWQPYQGYDPTQRKVQDTKGRGDGSAAAASAPGGGGEIEGGGGVREGAVSKGEEERAARLKGEEEGGGATSIIKPEPQAEAEAEAEAEAV
jgi:hypothetical protein